MLKGGRIMKDGVINTGQNPKVEDIVSELEGLSAKLPCYGSIKADRSLTGQILKISINCDHVRLIIAQDRRNGNGKLTKVSETFIIPIASITQVWELPDPFKPRRN